MFIIYKGIENYIKESGNCVLTLGLIAKNI